MNYSSSTNFLYGRDITITYFARKSDLPVKTILESNRDDLLHDPSSVMLYDALIYPVPEFVLAYLDQCDRLFPQAEKLFLTTDGNTYYPDKFHRRMRRILAEAGAKTDPANPKKMTEAQFQAILGLRFVIQRQRYQAVLAAALCSYLGLRPSEVAKLEKRDIDFSARLLHLRDTKSQQDQEIPMLSFLVEPLERYTHHLADTHSPLFINTQGAQWERRDVAAAISHWGAEHGVKSLTPRKLCASLGATLSRLKVEPALAAVILRHRDPATTLRHYNQRELEEARKCLEGVELISDDQMAQEYVQAYDHMYTMFGRDK